MWTILPPILSSSVTYLTQFPGSDFVQLWTFILENWSLAQRLNVCYPEKKKRDDDVRIILILGPEKGRKPHDISSESNKGGSRESWQVHKVTIFESKVRIWSPINNLSIAQWSKPKLFHFIKRIQCRLLYIPNGWTDVPVQPIFSISDWFIIWEELLTVYLLQRSNSSSESQRRAGLHIGLKNSFGWGFNLYPCCGAPQWSDGRGTFCSLSPFLCFYYEKEAI